MPNKPFFALPFLRGIYPKMLIRNLKKTRIIYLLVALAIFTSCKKPKTANDILFRTIGVIDTIKTIYYKQDMIRSNPRQLNDTIYRFREMVFKRLVTDSIVGVKGHWYFYDADKKSVNYEDIYDGNRLIRKNNLDSMALVYDLVKYPEFKEEHFWSHNTLYGMQYSFKYILDNKEFYRIRRLNDTIVSNKSCFQLQIYLENMTTMPGFATKLENSEGDVSNSLFFIDKETYYPIRMFAENYSIENPEQKFFIDQAYYDIRFNPELDENKLFNTSEEILKGFKIIRKSHPVDGS